MVHNYNKKNSQILVKICQKRKMVYETPIVMKFYDKDQRVYTHSKVSYFINERFGSCAKNVKYV